MWVWVLKEDGIIIRVGEYVYLCAGMGMSRMKRMKKVGENTHLCGTQWGKRLFVDGMPLRSVKACLPVRKLDSYFLK